MLQLDLAGCLIIILPLEKIYKESLINYFMEKGKLVYYLSWLTAIVVLIVILLEISIAFSLVENLYGSKFLSYIVYYSAALLIPLALLSSLLAFKFKEKKSIKLLVNAGIVYAVIKIILTIILSFRLFDAGIF
jgi:hypothetical protein